MLASEGVTVDLTVVDNGQRAGAGPALAEVLPAGVRVMAMADNRGYSGGANAALDDWRQRYPDGDVCLLASHDLHVAPDALARLVERARAEPDIGLLAPILTRPQARSGGVWDGRRSRQVDLIAGGPDLVERDWVSGACLLVRRGCADAVGPFDERFGSYMEDVDYGLRAGDHGWRVAVLTTAEVWGLGSSADDSVRRIAANTILLDAKRDGWRGAGGGLAPLRMVDGEGPGRERGPVADGRQPGRLPPLCPPAPGCARRPRHPSSPASDAAGAGGRSRWRARERVVGPGFRG